MRNGDWQILTRLTRSTESYRARLGWAAPLPHQLTVLFPEIAPGARVDRNIESTSEADFLWTGTGAAFVGGEAALDQLSQLLVRFVQSTNERALAVSDIPGVARSGFQPFTSTVGKLRSPFPFAFPIYLTLGSVIQITLANTGGATIPAFPMMLSGFKMYAGEGRVA